MHTPNNAIILATLLGIYLVAPPSAVEPCNGSGGGNFNGNGNSGSFNGNGNSNSFNGNGNSDNFNLSYGAVFYDTLQYLNVSNANAITFIPRSAATITVDSFDAFFIHTHTTNNPDALS